MGIEDLVNILSKEEGETLEFKEKVGEGVAKTIVAFANTRGGTILVGVGDNKKIKGIKHKEIEKINSIIQNIIPKPHISIREVGVDNKKILVIKVKRNEKLYSYKNTAYIRVGSSNVPLSISDITERLFETATMTFDSLPSEASVKELDDKLFQEYIEKRKEIRGVEGEYIEKSKLLKMLKIVHEKNLTNAGVLFFTQQPHKYIMGAKTRIIKFIDDSKNIIEEDTFIEGSIWHQIINATEKVLSLIPSIEKIEDLERKRIFAVPKIVLRESIANALVHKNYYVASEVVIEIYPDKIIITNPGGFPPGVKPDNPIHKPRNPLLSSYLYDVGLIEKYGSGIERMKKVCMDEGYPLPEYKNIEYFTKLILYFKYLGTDKDIGEEESRILNLLRHKAHTSSELSRKINKSKSTTLRILKKLEEQKLIRKIGKGRGTKYISL